MKSEQILTAAEMQDEILVLKADYLRACQTVAAMHEAATGRTGEAPWLGVVEDVAEVRKDAERYRFLRNTDKQDLNNCELFIGVDSADYPGHWALQGPHADKAIDAAIGAAK